MVGGEAYKELDKKNLTCKEAKFIKGLMNERFIVIKPVDKGTAIVILNRSEYLKEGYKQLLDAKFYKHVDEDFAKRHLSGIALRVESMFQDGKIDATVNQYLIAKTCRTARFFYL